MNKIHILDLSKRKKLEYEIFHGCVLFCFLTQANSGVCAHILRTVVFCGLVLNIKIIYHRLFFDRLGPGASDSDPGGKNQIDRVKFRHKKRQNICMYKRVSCFLLDNTYLLLCCLM